MCWLHRRAYDTGRLELLPYLELRARGHGAAAGLDGEPRGDLHDVAHLAVEVFELTGTFELSGTVPDGLRGNKLLLRSYAIAANGRVIDTFDEALELR